MKFPNSPCPARNNYFLCMSSWHGLMKYRLSCDIKPYLDDFGGVRLHVVASAETGDDVLLNREFVDHLQSDSPLPDGLVRLQQTNHQRQEGIAPRHLP